MFVVLRIFCEMQLNDNAQHVNEGKKMRSQPQKWSQIVHVCGCNFAVHFFSLGCSSSLFFRLISSRWFFVVCSFCDWFYAFRFIERESRCVNSSSNAGSTHFGYVNVLTLCVNKRPFQQNTHPYIRSW